MARPTCHAHPEMPAVASCSHCFVQLCAVCRQHDGLRALCEGCMRSKRRAPFVRAAALTVFVGAVCAGSYFALTRREPAPSPAGEPSSAVQKLEAQLEKEPCDRAKIEHLLGAMLDAGDSRSVIPRAEAFYARCGDVPRLRLITFRAHQRLGELDQAVADLTALIEAEPFAPYHRAWRGALYQDKGDLTRAAEDYRQALLLYPKATDIPVSLATLYEKQGKPCEALAPLAQLLFHHGNKSFTAGIQARASELAQKGGCAVAASSGKGRAVLRMAPNATVFYAGVRLGAKEKAMFVVDTGASYVTLTRALADRLGLDLKTASKAVLQTANGEKTGLFTSLPSIALDGIEALQVPAIVVDDLGPGLDGLLGLSFLTRFNMNQSAGILELSVRDAPPAPAASR